jgi:hypothetical protein
MAREKANPRRALPRDRPPLESTSLNDASTDSIKAAEEVALNAFAAGLRLAAAFGTVAAKTTSLALASLASGADKFSDLVKKEALASKHNKSTTRIRPRTRKKGTDR